MKISSSLIFRRSFAKYGFPLIKKQNHRHFFVGMIDDALSTPQSVDLLSKMPGFVTHSDAEYGGSSQVQLQNILSSTFEDNNSNDGDGDVDEVGNTLNDQPRMTFSGILRRHFNDVDSDASVNYNAYANGSSEGREDKGNEMEIEMTKSLGSFCALKALYLDPPLDLCGYEGVEVILRSSVTRSYAMNLSCFTVFEKDLYQFSFTLQKGVKTVIHIPFSVFSITSQGRHLEYQREADSLQIESFGFLSMERPQQKHDDMINKSNDITEQMMPSAIDEPFTLEIFAVRVLYELDKREVARLLLSERVTLKF